MENKFFSEQREQSKVKTAILMKYFDAWSKVMIPRSRYKRLGYIDLFSGPGKYEDGNKSTPLLILEKCINNEKLRKQIVTVFNDANPKFCQELKENIEALPNINLLKYKPKIMNKEVGDEVAKIFSKISLIPTLAFIDPWGYKGLTTNLINKSTYKRFWFRLYFFLQLITELIWVLITQ